jgi:hypothetical protein
MAMTMWMDGRVKPGHDVDGSVCGTPKEKSRLAAGPSFSHSTALTQFSSELAVLLALLALTTLTVRVLLLLAGFLTAALLLAGLLTRVLILLTRVLVLVRHSGSPF